MSFQITYDTNGEPLGVFIPIEQWNEITKKHKDLAKLQKNGYAEAKQTKRSKKTSVKNIDDILIPAINPSADISSLFGAWKNTKINSANIRNSSRRKEQLQW
jgi:hypothetical protein